MATDIDVRLNADAGPLRRGLRDGTRSVQDFSRRSAEMGRNVARAGAVVVTAMAGIAGAVLAAANEASQMALEIRNLSRVAGIGTTEFQRYAAASRTVGIEQDKLADILKDVNDKFGDYMATGAGPLADFFENIAPKIGVTADQFARLSGPEALQLYVDSLDKAGVSQQQMTFYMEALASDATLLIPLLQNGGRELKNFGDAAQQAGRIIDEDGIKSLVEMEQELDDMTRTLKIQATKAIIEYKDEILAVARFITEDLIPALGSIAQSVIDFAKDLEPGLVALREFANLVSIVAGGASSNEAPAVTDPSVVADEMAAANALGGGDTSSSGLFYVDENGNVKEYGTGTPELPGITAPLPPIVPPGLPGDDDKDKKGGGGSSGPTREDLEALQERLASEQEVIQLNYENQLSDLEEFRAAKLGSEAEYNDLEAKIKAEHLESMDALEKAAQQARLQAFSGAFGDLATLMQSENKKLFKIGQAAALAEATINGYSAAVASYDKGAQIGGPAVGALFAAASLAKTGMLISQIASASPAGGGGSATGGGTVPSTGSAAQEQASAPTQQRSITLIGDRFNRQQAIEIAEFMNEGTDDGLVIRGRR